MKSKYNSVGMSCGHHIKSTIKFLAAVAVAGRLTPAMFAQDSISVVNPSFEQGYDLTYGPGYTTVLPLAGWNLPPGAGINKAGDPFWANGGPVDGTYVGFIQWDGLFGQPTSGYQVGETYWIQFFASASALDGGGTNIPTLSVFDAASTAGGAPIASGIAIPLAGGPAGGGNPFKFINVPFVAAATSGDLNIYKSSPNGTSTSGDTLLVDGFSIIRRSPNDVVIQNPSFEASGTGQAAPGYVPAIAGWTIAGAPNGCAINQASGPFADNGTIPDGGNVLVLQSGRSVSQTLTVVPGMNYQLSLYLNGRAGAATPTALVQIGGNTAFNGAVSAVGGSNPYTFQTYTFTATTNNVTLVVSNATDGGTDSALLVDNLRVIKQAESINLANPSFEQGYNAGNWPYYGTIPGWASSVGNWGINDQTGPFWDNGGTVDGNYVGFIQGDGLLGQSTSGYQPGQTYWIQFYANARAADGGTPQIPTVAVFDAASTAGGGAIVSGITVPPVGGAAGGGSVFTLVNVPFTAAATSGDLNLLKSTPNGSDTLLLDGFSIIRRTTNDIVIQNPSFEASGTGQTFPGVVSRVAGWTLTGPGGPNIINQNGGPYLDGGEVVPDGNNALVIQNVCAYSQVLHGLTVGTSYRLTLYANSRHFGAANALITIDGKTAYNAPVPVLGSQPWAYITYDFVADATDVTLSIGNTTDSASYFVDDVRVYAPIPVAPSVVAQPTPARATRYAGMSFTLNGSVAGYPVPALQWQHNGGKIPGATNAMLTLTALQLSDSGSYALTATNTAGGTSSSAASLTVLPVTSAFARAVIAQNPLGYWRFSDGGGTNAYDYAGGNDAWDTNYVNNNNPGSTGNPATLAAGPQPSAFPGFEATNTAPFLDGLSQGYSASAGLFNNRSNFTLMGWFNIDPTQYPIAGADGSEPFTHPSGRASLFGQEWAAELGIYQGTNLAFYSTGISATIFANTNLVPGVWNFVAAVSDAAANTTTLYLNGAVVGTASACPGTANAYLFSIGKNVAYYPSGGYDNAFFPGSLDEVAAFDHPLSASAINSIYNTGAGVGLVNQTATNLTFSVSGGQMTLAWPTDHTGWVLEAQTNSLSKGLGTNWVRMAGSAVTNRVSVPVNPANPTVFYRLVYP